MEIPKPPPPILRLPDELLGRALGALALADGARVARASRRFARLFRSVRWAEWDARGASAAEIGAATAALDAGRVAGLGLLRLRVPAPAPEHVEELLVALGGLERPPTALHLDVVDGASIGEALGALGPGAVAGLEALRVEAASAGIAWTPPPDALPNLAELDVDRPDAACLAAIARACPRLRRAAVRAAARDLERTLREAAAAFARADEVEVRTASARVGEGVLARALAGAPPGRPLKRIALGDATRLRPSAADAAALRRPDVALAGGALEVTNAPGALPPGAFRRFALAGRLAPGGEALARLRACAPTSIDVLHDLFPWEDVDALLSESLEELSVRAALDLSQGRLDLVARRAPNLRRLALVPAYDARRDPPLELSFERFARLESLTLGDERAPPAPGGIVARLPPGLRELTLFRIPGDARTLATAAGAPRLEALRGLDLYDPIGGAAGLARVRAPRELSARFDVADHGALCAFLRARGPGPGRAALVFGSGRPEGAGEVSARVLRAAGRSLERYERTDVPVELCGPGIAEARAELEALLRALPRRAALAYSTGDRVDAELDGAFLALLRELERSGTMCTLTFAGDGADEMVDAIDAVLHGRSVRAVARRDGG